MSQDSPESCSPCLSTNCGTNDATYRNPIIEADFSDPDAIRVGGDFYMTASSFCNAPALPILYSRDLVHWRLANYALKGLPEFRYQNPVHGCGVWAPAIREHGGLFYIYFPMPDEGIYVITAKDPLGEWSEPVNIRPGAGWIDPCPFWDDDGRCYMVAGVAKSRIGYKSVLHLVELSPDGMRIVGEERRVFDGGACGQHTVEGPKLYKRNGWYYIFAPAGGVASGWQLVLRSKSIWGPYEHRVVLAQGSTRVNGPHQGAWIQTQSGQDWFLHFQDAGAVGRIVHLQPMRWLDDGWPVIGRPVAGETWGEPVEEFALPDCSINSRNSRMDSGVPQVPAWQWNANPRPEYGTAQRLNAVAWSPLRPLCDYPNLLLQRWPRRNFSCVTRIGFSGLRDGDMAGIVSLGMSFAALAVARREGSFFLRRIRGRQEFDLEAGFAAQSVEDEPLQVANDKEIEFCYTVREVAEGFMASLEARIAGESLGRLEFLAEAGRWVGAKNGIFCARDASFGPSGGFAAINSVRYDYD